MGSRNTGIRTNVTSNGIKLPDFRFEKKLWRKGLKYIAGIDEVGRGCFAGCVVTGCVVFPRMSDFRLPLTISDEVIHINDSKKLKPRQREKASKWIMENSVTWGIGEAPASLINRLGMAKATKVAFRRAVIDANKKLKEGNIEYLVIDAFYIPYLKGFPVGRLRKKGKVKFENGKSRQLAIINGDAKSVSVAAASIIAKVHRDKIMRNLGNKPKYKKYMWAKNKGYGSREHQDAILNYGITGYHRKQFIQTFLQKRNKVLPVTV